MCRLLDAIRLYFTCASISTRAQMQYRASFAMQAVGLMLAMGAELLTFRPEESHVFDSAVKVLPRRG